MQTIGLTGDVLYPEVAFSVRLNRRLYDPLQLVGVPLPYPGNGLSRDAISTLLRSLPCPATVELRKPGWILIRSMCLKPRGRVMQVAIELVTAVQPELGNGRAIRLHEAPEVFEYWKAE